MGPQFKAGVEVVQVDTTGLQLIDSLGREIGPVRCFGFAYAADKLDRIKNFIVFEQPTADGDGGKLGFWDVRTGLVLAPRFTQLGNDFRHGLLLAQHDQRLLYLNRAGWPVWTEDSVRNLQARLNLDYQRAAAYAGSSISKKLPEPRPRGWQQWYNPPRRLPEAAASAGQLQVHVDPLTQDTLYAGRYAGHRLRISNTTSDTLTFDAEDNQLYLVMHALTATGQWQDIELYPASMCGNSYQPVQLPPGHYWQLVVPAYAGSQPTRLRMKLTPRVYSLHQVAPDWYSNEFWGSINPGQLWPHARANEPRGVTEQD